MKHSTNIKGFTLIELAVVLVIIGILLGSVIGTLSSRIEVTRYDETNENLEEVKKALIAYAFSQGVGIQPILPCPDDPADTDADGLSNGDGIQEAACAAGANTGTVPWVTLGLGSHDSWNNRYEYWVDASFANAVFSLDTAAVGAIQTRSVDGTVLIPEATNIVAVIYSKGKNGFGATSSDSSFKTAVPAAGFDDEEENEDGDSSFVARSPTYEDDTTDVGTFDDIVIWISEYELKAKMVEAGKLP